MFSKQRGKTEIGTHRIYKYSFYDKLNIKKSNFFWKIVDLLASRLEKLGKLYEESISKEYKRENQLFNISNSRDILHIGCGAYPVTVITLSKYNGGGRIVGIDRNLKDVERARVIIKKMNLQNRISIEQGDGSSYPIEKFDTVIISSCSIPKKKILQHIFETARRHTKIIVREIYGPNRLVSDLIDMYEDIEFVKKIENHPFPTSRWESFYLIKK